LKKLHAKGLILSTPYIAALCTRHLIFVSSISFENTVLQIAANFIESPPAPQKPSKTVSIPTKAAERCSAIASGVMLNQDYLSNLIPSSNF
jgi:hypothetical protein